MGSARSRFSYSLLLILITQSACAMSLARIYGSTENLSDASTNISLIDKFPQPQAVGLELSARAQAWIERIRAAPHPQPFVLPQGELPSAAVADTERAVTAWQRKTLGRHDEDLLRLWPDFDPREITALKLAIERGKDRYTLQYLVQQDLHTDAAREQLLARIQAKAEAQKGAGDRRELTIINTDVDDTTIANLWDRGRYPRKTVYPGYLELLAAQGDFLVVLTARPSVKGILSGQTLAKYYELFKVTQLHAESVNIAVSPGEFSDLINTLEMGLIKAESLVLERRLFPEATIVFNGDSGQADWIAALILRDLEPAGFRYATIQDVRPWSRHHRAALRAAVAKSEQLERLYRRALGLGLGALSPDEEHRLDGALRHIREDIDLALAGPEGRLDGKFLRQRGIFLYRNTVDLAFALAAEHHITADAADRVIADAAGGLRFLTEHPFGFDAGDKDRVQARIETRAAGGGFGAATGH